MKEKSHNEDIDHKPRGRFIDEGTYLNRIRNTGGDLSHPHRIEELLR
jgi:hypothetical protein